ncbi:ABC transporter substrate-binding protein [Mesorhizobium opportunistum]|uniref:ABC transporter substrate-binding protein n=1 Tax=Mesorhizobium opportunistum TaxID=593909 RepID=A0ABV1YA69_9HYPH
MSKKVTVPSFNRRRVLLSIATTSLFSPLLIGSAAAAQQDHKHPTACRSPVPGADIIIGKRTDDVLTFDPHENSSSTAAEIIGNLYETLITWDGTTFAPGLANKWGNPSKDNLNWDFYLSPGHVFSTGNPVGPSDIIYSFKRLFIIGKAPASALTPLGLTSENIEKSLTFIAPNQLTISLPVGAATHLLFPFLASAAGSILDINEVKSRLLVDTSGPPVKEFDWLDPRFDRGAGWLKSSSAGSGPFRLINAVRSDEIVLQTNCYHPSHAKAHRIVVRDIPDGREQIRLLEKGKLDAGWNAQRPDPLVENSRKLPSRGQTHSNLRLRDIRVPRANLLVLGMNIADASLSDPVREAIKISIDRTKLVSRQNASRWSPQPHFCPSPLLPLPTDQSDDLAADPMRAKTLLNGTAKLSLAYAEGTGLSSVVSSLAEQLATVGIAIDLQPSVSGRAFFRGLAERNHQLALFSWSSDYLDPYSNAYAFCVNDDRARTPAWYCQWQNPTIAEQAFAAAVEPDLDKRTSLYLNLDHTLRIDGPYLFLLEETAQVTTKTDIPMKVGVIDNFTRYPLSLHR